MVVDCDYQLALAHGLELELACEEGLVDAHGRMARPCCVRGHCCGDQVDRMEQLEHVRIHPSPYNNLLLKREDDLVLVYPAFFSFTCSNDFFLFVCYRCMATTETSDVLLFIPLGVIMIPSTLLHVATFCHIIKVTLQAEGSDTVSHSTLSSGRAARITHRRHVMNAIRIQWRAAVLALVVSTSVLLYWSFYLVEGSKTDMSWMSTWQLCIFTKAGTQEECGHRFAKGHVPDFVFMMIAEGLVSTTGLWIFLLFFKQSLMMEWKEYMSGWICCGGRRHRRRAEDQFYVI